MKRLLFIFLILLAPRLADGGTFWVSKSGSDSNPCTNTTTPQTSGAKLTITNAMNNCLDSGGTLNIRTGTYDERLSNGVGSAVTWASGIDDTHRTTLRAFDGAGTAIIKPSAQNPVAILGWGGNDTTQFITIDGIVFDGTNVVVPPCTNCVPGGLAQVIFIPQFVQHITFINSQIINGGMANLVNPGDSTLGISTTASHILFQNVLFQDNGRGQNNAGLGNAQAGYHIYVSTTGDAGQSDDLVIDHCTFIRAGGFAIHIYGGGFSTPTNTIIRNSVFSENGISSYTAQLTAAILLSGGAGNSAYNNVIINNYSMGLVCQSVNAACYNNTVMGNGSWGITFAFNQTKNIRNNIAYNNAVNADGSTDIGGSDLTGVVADHNLCGTTSGLTPPGGCSTIGNPLVVNAAARPSLGDYHLQSGSPARGIGLTTLGMPYNVDKDGNSRPPWDAGAYIFGTSVTPFTVTIQSTNPSSAASITISPSDNGGNNNCTTPCSRIWNSGTTITLTAAANAGGNNFGNWSGCSIASGAVCTITNITSNLTVTAAYITPGNPNRTLTTTSNPSGASIAATVAPVSVTPFTQIVPDGTALTLKANATAQGPVWRSTLTSNSNDNSGNANNGVDTAISYSSGAVFNGTTSKIVVSASDFLRTFNEWTITATVTPSAGMTDFRAIAVLNYALGLYASTSGFTTSSSGHSCGTGSPIAFYEAGGGGGGRVLCRTAALTNGVTYKLVATRSLTGMEFYVDGTLTDSITGLTDGVVIPDNCSPPCSDLTFELGNSFYSEPLPGKLVNVGLYGRHFSSGDVTAYGNGTLSDGASFTSWQGCTSGSGVTCNVTMTQDRTITANYPSAAVAAPSLIVGAAP